MAQTATGRRRTTDVKMRALLLACLFTLLTGCAGVQSRLPVHAAEAPRAPYTLADIKAPIAPRNGSAGLQIPGVSEAMLTAEFWIARDNQAVQLRHSAAELSALNARTLKQTSNLFVLAEIPATMSGSTVREAIETLARSAKPSLLDSNGIELGEAAIARMRLNANLAALTPTVPVRWATVVSRADLRAVPDELRAYRKPEDIAIDIDRLQESAVFPGWAVAVLHTSTDGRWQFVNAYNYRAWVRTDALRFVDKAQALANDARVQPEPLPYTRANLLKTAFRYLGERYGWGHAGGTRDCSGFVSEVYAALGVLMPRNTGDQRDVPTFHARRFGKADGIEARERAVREAQPGDLLFIPGHVMMVLGRMDGETYVIHDTPGVRFPDGASYPLFGVSVTPLSPLMFDASTRHVDALQAVVRPLD